MSFAPAEIRGVIPAMLTPFDENEAVDLRRTQALARHLIAQGAQGLYLTGSTGEGLMMTPGEREAVVEAVMDAVAGRVPVIVHVGTIATGQAAALARHAARAGADAISSIPPIYWQFTEDEIAGYYADIVQAAALPMIVYNITQAARISFDLIERLGRIDGVAGIKYTAPTHHDIPRIKASLGEDFLVYSGCDEMAVSGLLAGADGIIGSSYNALPDLFLSLSALFASGDIQEASRLQLLANRLIFTLLEHNYMPALKQTLAWCGIDAGQCRRPFLLSGEQRQSLMRALTALKPALKGHTRLLHGLREG